MMSREYKTVNYSVPTTDGDGWCCSNSCNVGH